MDSPCGLCEHLNSKIVQMDFWNYSQQNHKLFKIMTICHVVRKIVELLCKCHSTALPLLCTFSTDGVDVFGKYYIEKVVMLW